MEDNNQCLNANKILKQAREKIYRTLNVGRFEATHYQSFSIDRVPSIPGYPRISDETITKQQNESIPNDPEQRYETTQKLDRICKEIADYHFNCQDALSNELGGLIFRFFLSSMTFQIPRPSNIAPNPKVDPMVVCAALELLLEARAP
jgi:hypothetical protein